MGKRAWSPAYFLRSGLQLSLSFFCILLHDFISSYNFKPISKMTTDLYCFFAWTFAWLPTACFLLEDSAATSDSIGRLCSIISISKTWVVILTLPLTLWLYLMTFLSFIYLWKNVVELESFLVLIFCNFLILCGPPVYLSYPAQAQWHHFRSINDVKNGSSVHSFCGLRRGCGEKRAWSPAHLDLITIYSHRLFRVYSYSCICVFVT